MQLIVQTSLHFASYKDIKSMFGWKEVNELTHVIVGSG
jgi:hypothetical protein